MYAHRYRRVGMMKNVVIACQTIKDELNLAIKETQCRYPVVWIDSSYHLHPDKLRLKLQEEVDNLRNIDNILLAYGFCGNAIVGLKASGANLIFPRTDDCISMVLGCSEGNKMKAAYFLTRGWIESPGGIMVDYLNAVKRYGEEKTERIFRLMLKHYNKLVVIDTGAYNLVDYIQKVQKFARISNLDLVVAEGSIGLLKKLLTGPYDDKFCIIKKEQEVNIDDILF